MSVYLYNSLGTAIKSLLKKHNSKKIMIIRAETTIKIPTSPHKNVLDKLESHVDSLYDFLKHFINF